MDTTRRVEVPGRPRRYKHAEAFALMRYHCEACGAIETLWNSRDGVTPFGIDCRTPDCVETMKHVHWQLDWCAPHYQPGPAMRVFANITRERAAEVARTRVLSAIGTEYEIPEEGREAFIVRLAADIYGDGTGPMIVTGEEWMERHTKDAMARQIQAAKTEVARRAGVFGPRHNGHQESKNAKVERVRRRKAQRAARRRSRR